MYLIDCGAVIQIRWIYSRKLRNRTNHVTSVVSFPDLDSPHSNSFSASPYAPHLPYHTCCNAKSSAPPSELAARDLVSGTRHLHSAPSSKWQCLTPTSHSETFSRINKSERRVVLEWMTVM